LISSSIKFGCVGDVINGRLNHVNALNPTALQQVTINPGVELIASVSSKLDLFLIIRIQIS